MITPLQDTELIINDPRDKVPTIKELQDAFTKHPESISKLFYLTIEGYIASQAELATNLADHYPWFADLNKYTGEFYERYFKEIGKNESKETTDRQQLFNRIVNHPNFQENINRSDDISIGFLGCGSGINNIEDDLMEYVQKHRPRGKKSRFVGVEPGEVEKHNPRFHAFHQTNLENFAKSESEEGQYDVLFTLGSVRMDILKTEERLKATNGFNRLLKKNGCIFIDEACPATSMPEKFRDCTYENNVNWEQAFHNTAPEGLFERKWTDSKGEFGKRFYAEPLEIYFTLMQEFGFTPTLANYYKTRELLTDERLGRPWNRIERFISRLRKPDPKDPLTQMMYQSTDGTKSYDRYVLCWQKSNSPSAEMINLLYKLGSIPAFVKFEKKSI